MTQAQPTITEPQALSVSQLSTQLKRTIEGEFTGVRVQGEISSLKRHSSGHVYFTLKDEDAVINGICWRGVAAKSQFQLEDGLQVVITGRVTIYEKRSNYQIIVDKFEPTGQGALLKLLEERKQRFAAAGLFDAERKLPLPRLPQVIGVVTSPTGAVIRDILHRISDRFPCHIIVAPVAVQGDGAAKQIASAIRAFAQLESSEIPKPDVLIVARGGGSLEDLWCFNEDEVVHAVAECQIPVISAVGHETDTTLIDYVSDKRAPTPTAAAEMAVPVLSDLWMWVQDRGQRMGDIVSKYLFHQSTHLQGLARGLPTPQRLIEYKVQRLDEWVERIQAAIRMTQWTAARQLDQASSRLQAPKPKLAEGESAVQSLSQRLDTAWHSRMTEMQQQLNLIEVRLEQGSYQSTLKRGFALALQDGQVVRRAKSMNEGEPIKLQFADDSRMVVAADAKTKQPRKKRNPAKKIAADESQGTLF